MYAIPIGSAIPELQENEVQLWIIDINKIKNNLSFYEGCLSLEEMAKANRFRFEKDRTVSIIARGALRLLLGHHLNRAPESLQLSYGAFGKPHLISASTIQFNVSHSDMVVIIGLTNTKALGVDVEMDKRSFEVMDVAQNFFSPLEIENLLEFDKESQVRSFYRCWTRKESIIKALGSGLSFPLDSFAVSLEKDNEATLKKTNWDNDEKNHWKLFSTRYHRDYMIAVALRNVEAQIAYYQWTDLLNFVE